MAGSVPHDIGKAVTGRAYSFCPHSHIPHNCHPERSRGVNSRLKCNTSLKEYLIGCFEAEAFSGGVVVAIEELDEMVLLQDIEVGFSGEQATQTTDSVFDAALLPGRVCVAEPRADSELSSEQIVLAELGAIVEGHGAAGAGREPPRHGAEIRGDRLSGF